MKEARENSTPALPAERQPWPVRLLLAVAVAAVAVGLNRAVPLLHSVPLILPFPVAIIACWYLGMGPGLLCAVLEGIFSLPLVQSAQNSLPGRSELRTALVFVVAMCFGWLLRLLDRQRAHLSLAALQQQLAAATAQREFAEERALAAELLREREDLLQIALRANGMGLWAWDLITGNVQWSDEVYRIVGQEPGAFRPSTAVFLDFIHPEDRPRVQTAVERSKATGADYHQQYRVLLPDGSERWVESQGRCQRDSEGHPRRVAGVIADVTARKRSEEAMLRAEKLAVAGRLAASIAHEINNPLEAVANLLYLIAQSNAADDTASLAHQALDELMRVSLITQQTLKFHRQAGAPRPTRLSEIVQTVFALFRGRCLVARIETDLRIVGDTHVSCMPGEIQQIFANLVSNAIDAMPSGGRLIVRLRASRDWRTPSVHGMRATFFDTGTGMDTITRARLFEPFFTTKSDTGTGLGLWVVAQLVERHHGSVSIWSSQSAASHATAVSVFLPFEIDTQQVNPASQPEELQPSLDPAL